MSGAASAQYDQRCPTCGAGPYEPCRTRTTQRVTDTHNARMVAYYRDGWAEVPEPQEVSR